jgi:hypothetical protein
MTFTMTVHMDDDAFVTEDGAHYCNELIRLLKNTADQRAVTGSYPFSANVQDVNGNTVGSWDIESD